MDANLQATLLAYKAYKIGRESVLRDRVPDDACFVRDCLSELESRPSTEEVVRRRLFYTLILAELHRRTDPVAFRESAMHLGEKLEQLGLPNPFPMFMSIIRATTQPPSTGNFGDITTSAVEPIQDSSSYTDDFGNVVTVDLAQSALGLSDGDLAKFDRFLQKSLREITRLHGLELRATWPVLQARSHIPSFREKTEE